MARQATQVNSSAPWSPYTMRRPPCGTTGTLRTIHVSGRILMITGAVLTGFPYPIDISNDPVFVVDDQSPAQNTNRSMTNTSDQPYQGTEMPQTPFAFPRARPSQRHPGELLTTSQQYPGPPLPAINMYNPLQRPPYASSVASCLRVEVERQQRQVFTQNRPTDPQEEEEEEEEDME
jgi:hypothetical protein